MIKDILDWVYTAYPSFKSRDVSEVGLDDLALWEELMREEVEETKAAIMSNNKHELLDGIVDLMWITLNIAAMSGIDSKEIEDYVERVRDSNYSKFCSNEQDAATTVYLYLSGQHPTKPLEAINTYYKKVGEKYVIFREDGKIMKSFKYKKV